MMEVTLYVLAVLGTYGLVLLFVYSFYVLSAFVEERGWGSFDTWLVLAWGVLTGTSLVMATVIIAEQIAKVC